MAYAYREERGDLEEVRSRTTQDWPENEEAATTAGMGDMALTAAQAG